MSKSTTNLRPVRSPAEWDKTHEQIARAVAQLVDSDDDAKALAFLIDIVSNVHAQVFALPGNSVREYSDSDKGLAALRILKEAYSLTVGFGDGMAEWLGYGEATAAKQIRKRA